MHKGVERDMEKQRVRLERQAEFEMELDRAKQCSIISRTKYLHYDPGLVL
jgi:hypothetical protein